MKNWFWTSNIIFLNIYTLIEIILLLLLFLLKSLFTNFIKPSLEKLINQKTGNGIF